MKLSATPGVLQTGGTWPLYVLGAILPGGLLEIQLNIVLGGCLVVMAAALIGGDPNSAIDAGAQKRAELRMLEDRFAREPAQIETAKALADLYFELGQPANAAAAIRAMPIDAQRKPSIAHRFARSLEASGRFDQALSVNESALHTCAVQLDLEISQRDGGCSANEYAALDAQGDAIRRMIRWGIHDANDPRARTAYALAVRQVRVASVASW